MSDMGGQSDRYSFGFIAFGVTVALPVGNPGAWSVSIDFVPGADIGFGIGTGYTFLLGENENECP